MDPAPSQLPMPAPPGVRLTQLEPHPCPYLPGRVARSRGMWATQLAPQRFEDFLNRGFRRSGHVLYQPTCPGCRQCIPLRIATESFTPSASQRRISRRNADLHITVGHPALTDEKFELYVNYLTSQHPETQQQAQHGETQYGETQHHKSQQQQTAADLPTRQSLTDFLYASPTETLEIEYRDTSKNLLGVGICDLTPTILSSVYFYWSPSAAQRSLGLFAAVTEIALARQLSRPWYHLGFWVAGSRTMAYKATLSAHELLSEPDVWRAVPRLPHRD